MTSDQFIHQKVLANGLNVLVHEMPWAQTVSIYIAVKAGPRYEQADAVGSAHYLEHILFDGSRQYPSKKEIHEAVERRGGYASAYTSKEYTCYYAKIIYQEAEFLFPYLRDLVLYPLMDEKDIQKEKGIISAERRMRRDQPSTHIWEMLDKFSWGSHPVARETLGSLASIKNMKKSDLQDYHKRFYHPGNCIVTIAGNIRANEAIQATETVFGGLDPSGQLPPKDNAPQFISNRLRVKIENRELENIQLLLGFSTKGRGNSHPDLRKLQLISSMINKELFYKLVDEMNVAYSAHNYLVRLLSDNAILAQSVIFDPSRLHEVVDVLVNTLKSLKFTPKMLEDAKITQKARVLLSLADSDELAEYILDQRLFEGEVKSPEQLMKEINSVTLSQTQELYSELLENKNVAMVLLGPIPEGSAEELNKKLNFS